MTEPARLMKDQPRSQVARKTLPQAGMWYAGKPERGSRCLKCFTLRLTETARYASEHGFSVFTTTLASSRWKSLEQINEAGRRAAALYPGTLFWEQNWRKGGLQDRRNQLLKEYDFYNQQYCGCEFSMQRLEKNETI